MNPVATLRKCAGSNRRRVTDDAERVVRWAILCCALLALPLTPSAATDPNGAARTARIVGLGAATCSQFMADVAANPPMRRDYLAWAQGFMSGIILSRPPDVDQGLDLDPGTFGLVAQLRFLEDHCARNGAIDFSAAVEALYKRLRVEGKT